MSSHGNKALFLSSVSAEFGSYRKRLARVLRRPALDVREQEDFLLGGGSILAKLDDYIRRCDGVVHLIGDGVGRSARPEEVQELRARYHDLLERLPQLGALDAAELAGLSYTQWEAYLALYHRRPLFVFTASPAAHREPGFVLDEAARAQQARHLARIQGPGKDVLPFADAEELTTEALRALHDVLPPARPATTFELALPGGRRHALRFLTLADFERRGEDASNQLAAGHRPSLARLRDRQYMQREEQLASVVQALERVLERRTGADFHDLEVLWIAGRSGCGKSVLLLQLMERMVEAGLNVLWLQDETELILPLLEALRPESLAPRIPAPDLIFVDDAYAPRGQETLELDAIRRYVSGAPEFPWPVLVTCGPPEFENKLTTEAADDGIHVQSWSLKGVRPEEAAALRGFFDQRVGNLPPAGPAFDQDEGLMVSLCLEMLHGSLETFAQRFGERIERAGLSQCLRLPLAVNRLYVNAPADWISPDQWESLAELNAEDDFSVLESEGQERYLRLTHPHVSDFIYRAVRKPGNPLAYANDLAAALQRAWQEDASTFLQLQRVVAGGHERLAAVDLGELARKLGAAWRSEPPALLQADPDVWSEVCCGWAVWSGRQPELELDQRFAADLVERAREALRHATEAWPSHWSWLATGFPTHPGLVEDALAWLGRPESASSRMWFYPWVRLSFARDVVDEHPELYDIGWRWLEQRPGADGWGTVFERFLALPDMPPEIGVDGLFELGLGFLRDWPNRNQWTAIWNGLLDHPRRTPSTTRALARFAEDWLRAGRPHAAQVWMGLSTRELLEPGTLLRLGWRWLREYMGADGWGAVFQRLLLARELPPEIDGAVLVREGCRFLAEWPGRSQWAAIWEGLVRSTATAPEERARLIELGRSWLLEPARMNWGQVWLGMLELDGEPAGELLDLGVGWIDHPWTDRTWSRVWARLMEDDGLLPDDVRERVVERALRLLEDDPDREDWTYIWRRLWELEEEDGPGRVERLQRLARIGMDWLAGRQHQMRWSIVWESLLQERDLVGEDSFRTLVDWGLELVRAERVRIERGVDWEFRWQEEPDPWSEQASPGVSRREDWSIVWERLIAHGDLPAPEREELVRHAVSWLGRSTFRKDWAFVWRRLTDEDPLPDGVDRAALIRAGLEWLREHIGARSWPWIWARMTEPESLAAAGIEGGELAVIGERWAQLNRAHDSIGIVSAQVLCLAAAEGRSTTLAESFHRWLHEDAGSRPRWSALRILRIAALERWPAGLTGYEPLDRELQRSVEALRGLEPGQRVRGRVVTRVRGGLLVELEGGVGAFMPNSQLDRRKPRSTQSWVGSEVEARVLSLDIAQVNVVISRRQLLEEERQLAARRLLESVAVGDRLRGRVTHITDFGAFVDLGGVDGLLHLKEMSWERVSHPSERLALDQEVEVVVVDVDLEAAHIYLGQRQLLPSPWEVAGDLCPVGSRRRGVVVSVQDYGAIVRLEPGIEGLVHVSELSWASRTGKPQEFLTVGQDVEVVVIALDETNRRISLSIKRCEPDPWSSVAERYPEGSLVEGQVKRLVAYGAFIEVDRGVDGLLHVSHMSWTRKPAHPREMLAVGERVRCKVLRLEVDRQRMELSLREASTDPWEQEIPTRYPLGACLIRRVSNVVHFGAFVELEPMLDGLIHRSELPLREGQSAADVLSAGVVVEVRVIRLDPEERKLGLGLVRILPGESP